jgi:hypothetical protein
MTSEEFYQSLVARGVEGTYEEKVELFVRMAVEDGKTEAWFWQTKERPPQPEYKAAVRLALMKIKKEIQ